MKSATDLALRAYDKRPTRAESLYELARHFRGQNMTYAALLFARKALEITYPKGDLLFVEDSVYRYGARQEYAISAYGDDLERHRGREVCDSLALDRSIPAEVRDEARHNLSWYGRGLSELAPSFTPARLQFEPPQGWRAMNPSVCNWGDAIAINIRAVNYTIDDAGRYIMPDGAIRTRNFIGALDPDEISRLRWANEIKAALGDPLYDQVIGLEDIRLCCVDGTLFASATVRQLNQDGWCEIIRGPLRSGLNFGPGRILSTPDRHEKNWMPIAGTDRFIYKCDPSVVASAEGGRCLKHIPSVAAENFSGGSQAIPFHGGHLALIHEAIQSPRDGKRCYQHRFVWFDAELKLQKISHRFYFEQSNQIEFASGLCWHQDGERLVISYGIRDAEAWVATIIADEVYTLVNREEVVPHPLPAPCTRHNATAPVKAGADSLRYNQPLLSMAQVNEATAKLVARGLPQHPDVWKNWDTWLAIEATEDLPKDAIIMDAGGTRESAFLPALAKFGYKNLQNLNLDVEEASYLKPGGIAFIERDITDTYMSDGRFDFVACLSVIEHGVDWRLFLREMARILRPGGKLCLSFDYWETEIDCGDRMAFGYPVKIFQREEVLDLVNYAARHGLALHGNELDLRCRDKVVNWLGLDYTFLCLLFICM